MGGETNTIIHIIINNMKTKILSLLFVLFVFTSNAQETSSQKMLDLYFNCQYKEALQMANLLLHTEDSGWAMYYIPLNMIEFEKDIYKDSIVNCLEKMVFGNYKYSLPYIEAYFSEITNNIRGEKVKKKSFMNFCESYPQLKYPEVSYRISEISQKDQWYRGRGSWRYDCMKSKDSLYWVKQKQYDSTNLIEIERIFDQYGWPTDDIFGKNASFNCFFVIQHSNIQQQEKYLPVIDSLAKLNKVDAWDFFMLKDRVLVSKGEKQLFGTQSYFDKETGDKKRYPQVDYETMERIMLEYGVKPKQK